MWRGLLDRHGRVNLLINNAARSLGKRICDLKLEDVRKTLDINFFSIVQLTKLFLAQYDRNNDNFYHLVNINSIGGRITSAHNADYSASKYALTAFTDALR